MPKTFGKFERAYARLKGLILRSAHAGKLPQTPEARKRVSKDEAEQVHAPSCFETHRSATMLGRKRARSRCDAPQHEGRGRTAHFGEAKPMCPHWKSSPRKRGPMITGRWSWVPALRFASAGTTVGWFGRRTDPRLQETIAGSAPLFADCYLQ